jgi:hypothetical protein
MKKYILVDVRNVNFRVVLFVQAVASLGHKKKQIIKINFKAQYKLYTGPLHKLAKIIHLYIVSEPTSLNEI